MTNKFLQTSIIALSTCLSIMSVAQANNGVTKFANFNKSKMVTPTPSEKQAQPIIISVPSKTEMLPKAILKKTIKSRPGTMMRMGGVNGGGGTSVRINGLETLVFWDLYANNPLFTESVIGDQIQSNNNTQIQKVNYSSFQSFQILKQSLSPLEKRFPNLYNLITKDNFLTSDSTLALFSMTMFVKNPEELFRKYDYWPDGVTLSPLAHFDEQTKYIFMNAEMWNQMGLDSQAGFLLHERLRQIQVNHNELTNELIQGIVSYVIDPKFAGLMEFEPNDGFFNFDQPKRSVPLNPIGPNERFQQLLKIGFFSDKKTEVTNPTSVGNKNFKKTAQSETLLSDMNNCASLVSGFESVTNTFRAKLYCGDHGPSEGSLAGTGELFFQTPLSAKKITIDVEASLYSPNDGGSTIGLNIYKNSNLLAGIQTKVANYGQPHISTNLTNATYPTLTEFGFSWQTMKSYNTYRIVIDRETKMYSVYMITQNQSVLLASSGITDEINLNDKNLFWSFSINNNSIVKKIEIKQ